MMEHSRRQRCSNAALYRFQFPCPFGQCWLVKSPGLFAIALLCLVRFAGAQGMPIHNNGQLESGWQNRSWGAVVLSSTAPEVSDSKSIKVDDPGTGGTGFKIWHEPMAAAPYARLVFMIYPAVSGSGVLEVSVSSPGVNRPGVPMSFSATDAGHWQRVTFTMASLGLGSGDLLDGISIKNTRGRPVTYYIHSIQLTPIPPPPQVTVKVDPKATVRTIDSRLFGINLADWDPYLSGTSEEAILRQMGTKVVRLPGGSASDDYHWADESRRPTKTATFALLAEKLGASAFVTVNYGTGTPEEAAAWVAYYNSNASSTMPIGVDSQGRDWQTAGYWAALRGAAPLATDDGFNDLRISHPRPFGIRDWEIGNECYGLWEKDSHGANGSGLGGRPHNAETYGREFAAFYAKMDAVDPAIHIGAVATPLTTDYPQRGVNKSVAERGWTPVMLNTLKSEGATPDFLIHHYYSQNAGAESDAFLLQSAARLSSDAVSLRAMAVKALGASGSGVEMDVTELNSVSSDPGKQASNLVNALFQADAIGQIANTEFNACTWWDFRNGPNWKNNNSPSLYGWRSYGDYGVVSHNVWGENSGDYLNPNYYMMRLLSEWAHPGDTVIKAETNYVYLSAYAVRAANGDISLLVINKDPAAPISAGIYFGLAPKEGAISVHTYGESKESARGTPTFNNGVLTYKFPQYSVTVMKLNMQ
jgi:alpha-L-arabinofuranosidase